MQGLRTGLCGQKEMTVEEKDLSSVTGNIGAKVLSTHCLVLLVELASRSVVEKLLGEGQMVVGTWIGIRHLAAVPLGLKVRAESTLREIEGRKDAKEELTGVGNMHMMDILSRCIREMAMRKTTVQIDESLLAEAIKATGAKTKKAAIEAGLKYLVQRKNREALRQELGTFDIDLTLDELERLRNAE